MILLDLVSFDLVLGINVYKYSTFPIDQMVVYAKVSVAM
jgi:hypothetical protein